MNSLVSGRPSYRRREGVRMHGCIPPMADTSAGCHRGAGAPVQRCLQQGNDPLENNEKISKKIHNFIWPIR